MFSKATHGKNSYGVELAKYNRLLSRSTAKKKEQASFAVFKHPKDKFDCHIPYWEREASRI